MTTWRTLSAVAVALAIFTAPAYAKSVKKKIHYQAPQFQYSHNEDCPAYNQSCGGASRVAAQTRDKRSQVNIAAKSAPAQWGSGGLIDEARRNIGASASQLGLRRDLWCAAFMNMVLERSGYRGTGSNMARDFARYGRRVDGPQIGSIAVMSRGKNGGHVGIVSGIDAAGNVILISGNHNNRVQEAAYPHRRIYAYVLP